MEEAVVRRGEAQTEPQTNILAVLILLFTEQRINNAKNDPCRNTTSDTPLDDDSKCTSFFLHGLKWLGAVQ